MFLVDLLTLWSAWDDFQHGTKVHIQDRGVNYSPYTQSKYF